jgi:hypothetical protein
MRITAVVVFGADDPELVARAGAAMDRWDNASNAGIDPAAERRSFEEAQRLAGELDAAADARAVEGLLTDEHATSLLGQPVVLVGGMPHGPLDFPPGSVVEVEPSGTTLRRWAGGAAVAATDEEMAEATLNGRAAPGEFSWFSDEEHDIVSRARVAGFTVQENIVHRPGGLSG